MYSKILIAIFAVVFSITLSACDRSSSAEEVGKQIDETVIEIKDRIVNLEMPELTAQNFGKQIDEGIDNLKDHLDFDDEDTSTETHHFESTQVQTSIIK